MRHHREVAAARQHCLRSVAARVVAMIRINAIRLAAELMEMRVATDTALARVVKVFGAAR